tara:strand:+ start:1565 stop:2149 length:585 start_codon:yes stop_codon:yes gene_type:complete
MKNILAAVLILTTSFGVHANRGRARTMIDRMEKEARTGRITPRDQIEHQQKRFEMEVYRSLRNREGMDLSIIKKSVLREYIKKNKATPQNLEALETLFENITARGDVVIVEQNATAALLAEAIVLGSRRKFTLETRDILEIDRNWTVAEKNQLTDVLTEARSLMDANPALTPNKAFEQALGNRGLLEEFNRRCK